jgi:hypothetical protein
MINEEILDEQLRLPAPDSQDNTKNKPKTEFKIKLKEN